MDTEEQIATWQAKLDALEATGDDGAHAVRDHLSRLRGLAGEHDNGGRLDADREAARWRKSLADREERYSRLGPLDADWLTLRREIHTIQVHLRRLRSLA